ncbi:pentatricopeptide repeat-containing protein At2g39620 [Cryptomeria japonica]|uniref:pentatricopeptide repeat-containing protein At2g39620 n=1 Tax=Cryptomeria japonica TaxID=3369 RepID=UPI0027DA2845|nr:pentatricopeptide repeat-containing protein At2g39620 [Cryptomeria japonica]
MSPLSSHFLAHRQFAFATRTTFHNKLINMYAKCGSLVDARKVFNQMKERDSASWNTIIAAYRRFGYPHEAVTLFQYMQQTGFQPNKFTFASVIPACAELGFLEQGMDIHQIITEGGFLSDIVVGNCLVDMYIKCGRMDEAREVFDRMTQRDVISWTAIIAGYTQNGYVDKALEIFKQMQLAGVKPNSTTFVSILPACAKLGALEQGMDIHQSIGEGGFLPDVTVATALVDMYAKCGSIDKACELFDRMPQRDVVSWNAMIAGYALNGFVAKALETFKQMQLEGIKPNSKTFASILSACAKVGALEQGMDIHHSIIEGGFLSDIMVGNALVDMYAKCGSICKARELFDKMSQRNVVSWTAVIAGYAQNGFVENALETFKQMQLAAVKPDSTTFASILSACAKMGALEQGIDIHQRIEEGGFLSDIIVGNALIDMYVKCGSIDKASELFHRMPQRDVISWTAMIAGYVQNGFVEKALETFKQMQLAGLEPNSTTYASILPACAKMGDLQQGTDIHQNIMDRGILSDVVVATALVDMYAKCGRIDKARELFDRMSEKDVISWNAMIAGYEQNGIADKALETFSRMQLRGVIPNSATFASILPACAKKGTFEEGMDIHQSIKDKGILSDIVATSLVDMYSKCGSIDKARELFDRIPQRDVVLWTAMMTGCTQNGFLHKALETFKQMLLAGVKPNSTTFACVLSACAKMGALQQGMAIHRSIMEGGFLSDVIVATALVDMYAKCGSMVKACELFDRIPQRDVFSWTAMIAGYAQNGFVEKALETFKQMQLAGVNPNSTTFASILPACAKMGALEHGMDIHQSIEEGGFFSDVKVGNSLIDMYAKCGSVDKARELFDSMPQRDVISWNAMFAGYAQNGFCMDALKIFELMKQSGTYPDSVSFACVLCACSHAGLVDEGCAHFNHMNNSYGIIPTVDHYKWVGGVRFKL